jgi:hypothetical protein
VVLGKQDVAPARELAGAVKSQDVV